MAYAKINSVTNANMAKVNSAAKAALGKIGSIDAPAAGLTQDYSDAFTFTMITTNAGSASDTFVLPLSSSGTIDFWVDWGDNSEDNITAYDQAEITHDYGAEGTYTVRLVGTIRGFRFNNGGDKAKILDISKWGDMNFVNDRVFYGCSNLTISATDTPTTTSGTISGVLNFRDCTSLVSLGSNWDMSMITDTLSFLFGATSFNDTNAGNWDTSNVTRWRYMMYNCSSFNQNVSGWDITGTVGTTNMDSIMYGVTLSTANYDALLIGWNAQSVLSGLSPNFGSSKYTEGGDAEAARANLISSDSWTITDGGTA